MSVDGSQEINFSNWLEARVASKTNLANKLISSKPTRQSLLDRINPWKEGLVDTADVAIMLGTSPRFSNFQSRVEFSCQQLKDGKVKSAVFTGKSDRETQDKDQSRAAADMAVSYFGIAEDKIHLAGGDNTEENLRLALETIKKELPDTKSVLIISEAPHLLRANILAKKIFTDIKATVLPVNKETNLDINSPHVVTELVKIAIYHNTIEGGPNLKPNDLRKLKDKLRPIVESFTKQIFEKFPLKVLKGVPLRS